MERNVLLEKPLEQTGFTCWEQMIQDAVREPDPILSNHKITRCHYLLSCALQQVIGPEAGANFHSWAVWGSLKAGVTIRQEDTAQVRRAGTVIGAIVGGLVSMTIGLHLPTVFLPIALLCGVACGAFVAWHMITWRRRISADRILAGNRTVLEDIGTQTARFIDVFYSQTEADSQSLVDFLAGLRPGGTAHGGQDLLRQAFTSYFTARFAQYINDKQEATCLANCQAVFHEHIRLTPYILGAMPWLIRRYITRYLLQFNIGPIRLAVADDVSVWASRAPSVSPRLLEYSELREFVSDMGGFQSESNFSPLRHCARDWTRIEERMRYIVALFHVFHLDPVVCSDPSEVSSHSAATANALSVRTSGGFWQRRRTV